MIPTSIWHDMFYSAKHVPNDPPNWLMLSLTEKTATHILHTQNSTVQPSTPTRQMWKYLTSLSNIHLTQNRRFSAFRITSPHPWIPLLSLNCDPFFHFPDQIPSFMAAVYPASLCLSPSRRLLAAPLPPANVGNFNFLNLDARLLFLSPPLAPPIRFL